MSWLGIARGLYRIVEGVIEADGAKILKGISGTTLSTVGVAIKHVHDEETG